MYEDQTLHQTQAALRADVACVAEIDALDRLVTPLAAAPQPRVHRGFELPARVWFAMLGCYTVFFAAILLATGGSASARFAIVVSVLYTAVYFGVARIGARQAGPEVTSPLDRGQPLMTWTGPMDTRSVYGQILIVPFAVALFAVSILLITLFTGVGG